MILGSDPLAEILALKKLVEILPLSSNRFATSPEVTVQLLIWYEFVLLISSQLHQSGKLKVPNPLFGIWRASQGKGTELVVRCMLK